MSEDYIIDSRLRIRSPGKFEREPRWVPHFYQLWLEGAAHEDRGCYASIYVNAEDVASYPELAGFYEVNLHEDANGFVVGYAVAEPRKKSEL